MANIPTDKALYERIKQQIKGKMTWPSAYASLQLVRQYKAAGGKYRTMAHGGGLTKWLGEKWVDLSRPKPSGGYEPCGRAHAHGKNYPKCVPASKAASMSEGERKSAVRRKRTAQGGRMHREAIHVATFADALKRRKE